MTARREADREAAAVAGRDTKTPALSALIDCLWDAQGLTSDQTIRARIDDLLLSLTSLRATGRDLSGDELDGVCQLLLGAALARRNP